MTSKTRKPNRDLLWPFKLSMSSMSAHNTNHQWLWGILLGSVLTASSIKVYNMFFNEKHPAHRPRRDSLDESQLCPPGNVRGMEIVDGVDGLIGNTPLMRIRSLSEATGCTILVSSSLKNPSVADAGD